MPPWQRAFCALPIKAVRRALHTAGQGRLVRQMRISATTRKVRPMATRRVSEGFLRLGESLAHAFRSCEYWPLTADWPVKYKHEARASESQFFGLAAGVVPPELEGAGTSSPSGCLSKGTPRVPVTN